MSSENEIIPLEIAHTILARFGITEPTPEYERWVRPNGFAVEDFDSVLSSSRYIFAIDWRACLQEEIESIRDILKLLDPKIQLGMEFSQEGDDGHVPCGDQRVHVKYRPNGDSPGIEDAIWAIQSIIPGHVEIRAWPHNGGSDTVEFAILLRDEWSELDKLAPGVIKHFFIPLQPLKKADPKKPWYRRLF